MGEEQDEGGREVTGADADVAADTREEEVTAHDGSCGRVEFALYLGVAWIRSVGHDSSLRSLGLHQSCKLSSVFWQRLSENARVVFFRK